MKKAITKSRSPLGLRGLKFVPSTFSIPFTGRSPLGLRGLKSMQVIKLVGYLPSQPSWAAWIEIVGNSRKSTNWVRVAAHSGCVD